MNTKNTATRSVSTAPIRSKKQLFGLSVEELKLVTGGGGVIIQSPNEMTIITGVLLTPFNPAPQPAPLPEPPMGTPKP